MKSLAIFLPNWIGDVVMATPAIRALRERYPDARMLSVAKPYVAKTLEGLDWFQDSIPFDKNGPADQRANAVIRRLRRERIDTAVLFPNSLRSAMVASLGRCRRRVGFVRYGRGLLLTDRLRHTRVDGRYVPTPAIDDYNRLARVLDTPDPGYRMELGTTANDEAATDAAWRELGLSRFREVIVLNNSGAFGAAKLWTVESFAALARRFVDERQAGILIVCGPNERTIAREIRRMADRGENVVTLADQPLSLGLTKACVKRGDLLVTTDSGPRHFAAAFDRPVVTLFGPTFIEWTETYYAKAINLQKKVDCGPCQKRICPLDHRCMTGMTVDEVYAASLRLLPPAATRRIPLVG
jgi:heptosyltransferase II